MEKKIDAVITIPFCEKEYDILIDTIRSIEFYVKDKYHIIAVDDNSPSRVDVRLREEMPGITVLRTPRCHGPRSGLYITLAEACKYALEYFDFKVFVKMDTDALMVGSSLVPKSIERFQANPRLGLLGSYKCRPDGKPRNWYMWKVVMSYESSILRRLLGKPVLWKQIIRDARKNGYDLGENVLGGSYVLSERCLKTMHERGYLDYEYENVLTQSKLGEDVIYGLYCRASGYEISDFGRDGEPMVMDLDYLPIAKEEIVARGKALIHSIKKGKDGETQEELREYFRSMRK